MVNLKPLLSMVLIVGVAGLAQTPTPEDFKDLFDRSSLKYTESTKAYLMSSYKGKPLTEFLEKLIKDHESHVAFHSELMEKYLAEANAALQMKDSPRKEAEVYRVMTWWRPYERPMLDDAEFMLAPGAIYYFKNYRPGMTDSEKLTLSTKATTAMAEASIDLHKKLQAVGIPSLAYLNRKSSKKATRTRQS